MCATGMNWQGSILQKVDYVFTTVPLEMPVPVPVLEVSSFLKEGDAAAVQGIV